MTPVSWNTSEAKLFFSGEMLSLFVGPLLMALDMWAQVITVLLLELCDHIYSHLAEIRVA